MSYPTPSFSTKNDVDDSSGDAKDSLDKTDDCGVKVTVKSRYLDKASQPDKNNFAFSYTISVTNQRSDTIQLISRHWIINDQSPRRHEVKGQGVVGKQPVLAPGATFEYSSGAVITTEIGDMTGSYTMRSGTGELFNVPISTFVLAPAHMLH